MLQKSLYVTGIEYEDGYDWRQGSVSGPGKGKLFLMKDGIRILETDIGSDNCISADADMHRCIGGHLYTDFSTDSETIIKRDGDEVFRYFGREMIVGMLVKDDGIHTLGQPRNGSGWACRKNGETLLHKGSGSLISGLHEDRGNIYFAYEDRIETQAGNVNRYYLVENTEVSLIKTADDVTKIDNAVMAGGTLYYTAQIDRIAPRLLFRGPDGQPYGMEPGTGMRDCRIIHAGEKIFTRGEVLVNGRYEDWFWTDTERLSRNIYPVKAVGWCSDSEKLYYTASMTSSGTGAAIFDGEALGSLPVDYDVIYSSAIGADGGRCCAGLVNKVSGNRPALWIDGKITDYDFNGVFTSVSYW